MLDAGPLKSLFFVAFSAMAAATRDEWSDARSRLAGIEGEFKRNEASGSFNSDGCNGWENSNVCFFEGGSACLHGGKQK
nr:hypothetical protein Iba_chr12aCG2820 [Ipomoea batatas]GMD62635.1 hypothetical protein Iba_chr12bCG7290 [Ipomoea batatas]